MGAASTKNVQEQLVESTTEVTSKITSNQSQMTSITQAVNIKADGDIDYSNNKQSIKSSSLMQGVMDAAMTQSGQNAMANTMSQAANSELSGINFGSYAESENEIKNSMSSVMKFTSEVSQSCANTTALKQEINLEAGGNVKFQGNEQSVINKSVASCAMTSSSITDVTNSLESATEQTASAKVVGLSGLEFVMVALAVVIGGCVVTAIGAKAVGNTVGTVTRGIFGNFPYILALGAVVMGALMISGVIFKPSFKKGDPVTTLFSAGMMSSKSCRGFQKAQETTEYASLKDAIDFFRNSEYTAMDFMSYTTEKKQWEVPGGKKIDGWEWKALRSKP